MAGDFGKVDASAYAHRYMTTERVEDLETALADWLATKPGSFSSPGPCGCYDKALARFSQWSGRQDTRDNFEIALANCGFRAGVVVFNGEARWLMILPSSVDGALDRLAAMEN